jgi:predicted SprT family Zn-dependent metalloprotease
MTPGYNQERERGVLHCHSSENVSDSITMGSITLKRLGSVQGDLKAAAARLAIASVDDGEVRIHLECYVPLLGLDDEPMWVTTNRPAFELALGRRVGASIGGAYVYHPKRKCHLILINLARIDRAKGRAVELVVVEELVHMRDWIDGDRRRHARHGHDRIAMRVSELTGATLEEIRNCLLPVRRREVRYLYRCPGCQRSIERKRQGVWSCARCAPRFDQRYIFVLERDFKSETMPAEYGDRNRPELSQA